MNDIWILKRSFHKLFTIIHLHLFSFRMSRDLVRSFKILDISFALDPVKKIFWDILYTRK